MWCIEFLDIFSGYILLYIYSKIHDKSLNDQSNLYQVLGILTQSSDTMWSGQMNITKKISEQDYHGFNLFCQILQYFKIDEGLKWVPLRSRKRLLDCFRLITKFMSLKLIDTRTQCLVAIFHGFFKVITPFIKKDSDKSEEASIMLEIILPMIQSAVIRQRESLIERKINYFTQIYPTQSVFRYADKASNIPLSDINKIQLLEALNKTLKSTVADKTALTKFDIHKLFITDEQKQREEIEQQRKLAEAKLLKYQNENADLMRKIQQIEQHKKAEKPIMDTEAAADKIFDDVVLPAKGPEIRQTEIAIPDKVSIQAVPLREKDLVPQISNDTRKELLEIQKDITEYMKTLKPSEV